MIENKNEMNAIFVIFDLLFKLNKSYILGRHYQSELPKIEYGMIRIKWNFSMHQKD